MDNELELFSQLEILAMLVAVFVATPFVFGALGFVLDLMAGMLKRE